MIRRPGIGLNTPPTVTPHSGEMLGSRHERLPVRAAVSQFTKLLLFCVLAFVLVPIFLVNWLGGEEDPFGPRKMGGRVMRGPPPERDPVYLPPEKPEFELPILLWWTPFTAFQRIERECSLGSCLFTHSHTEQERAEAIFFYGTDIKWSSDLPLPRWPQPRPPPEPRPPREQLWVLLHEESPKNNWVLAHQDGISLFNITSTCSRHSDYPLVSQYLQSLEKLTQTAPVVPTKEKSSNGLAPVVFVHSDCDPPSDRDSYVRELMKHIKVDSYGTCLHNKDLPEPLRDPLTFASPALLDVVARYKFSLAFENAICDDYITEKFWRPLYAGSIPIVRGSPSIKDWAPSDHSIIVADDYASPQELAQYLQYLDQNDKEYEKYLEFKKTGITNQRLLEHVRERVWDGYRPHDDRDHHHESTGTNHIEAYECYVCDKVLERREMARNGVDPLPSIVANMSHYNCPSPSSALRGGGEANWHLRTWQDLSGCARERARVLTEVIGHGGTQSDVAMALKHIC